MGLIFNEHLLLLMTLIICESLREIGEVACVTSAWSSRGQTLKAFERKRSLGAPVNYHKTIHIRIFCFPTIIFFSGQNKKKQNGLARG